MPDPPPEDRFGDLGASTRAGERLAELDAREPEEQPRPSRPRGRYTSAVQLPGNFLSEGSLIAHVSIMSHFPSTILHAYAPNAVAFQVVDEPGEGSARGDYVGPMPGVVRPLLDWTTHAE